MTDHTTIPGRNSRGTVRLADLPDATIPSNTDSLAARDALSAVLATAPGSWQRADAAADLLAILGVPVSDLLQPEPEPELAATLADNTTPDGRWTRDVGVCVYIETIGDIDPGTREALERAAIEACGWEAQAPLGYGEWLATVPAAIARRALTEELGIECSVGVPRYDVDECPWKAIVSVPAIG